MCETKYFVFFHVLLLNVKNSTRYNIHDQCNARSNKHITNYIFVYNDGDLTLDFFSREWSILNTMQFS